MTLKEDSSSYCLIWIKSLKNSKQKKLYLKKDLTAKRAPEYYGEEFYSEKDAQTAKEWAEVTKKFVEDIMKNLQPSDRSNSCHRRKI